MAHTSKSALREESEERASTSGAKAIGLQTKKVTSRLYGKTHAGPPKKLKQKGKQGNVLSNGVVSKPQEAP